RYEIETADYTKKDLLLSKCDFNHQLIKLDFFMEILKIQALRGPNIWSVRRKKLIQMRLDLQEMEERPTNKIEGFRERLEKLIPSLIEHRCSEGVRGGFFMRVDEGTWMGHVIEHIALEIQTLAGMDTGFRRTTDTKE